MAKKQDLRADFPGLTIFHQKIPSHEVGRHEHEEHEFFLPLQGEITVTFGKETVKAGPGRMLYVPPGLEHGFTSSAQGSGERVIWLVQASLWKKHARGRHLPCSFPVNTLAKELVFYLLLRPEAKGAAHFIGALVETLSVSLESAQVQRAGLRTEHLGGKVADERVRRAICLMEEAPASASVAEVAKKSGLSLRNFSRLFLKETGLGPKDFLILRRMALARRLLRESKLSVTEISLECGYSSLSKFIETFKRIEGVLPSDFRSHEN